MAKVTTEAYGKVAAEVLALPRRNRDMLERALVEKRSKEDAAQEAGREEMKLEVKL